MAASFGTTHIFILCFTASTTVTCANFVPFGDVDALKPQGLKQFCGISSSSTTSDSEMLQRCGHSFKETLGDGGEVYLKWQIEADPDKILLLDAELTTGARIVRCISNELQLQLPQTHLHHVQEGSAVVASHFIHGCPHLPDRHLYSRIVRVLKVDWQSDQMSSVVISTQELPSVAHVLPRFSFMFSYMPVEANNYVEFPEMRTNFQGPTAARQLRGVGVTWDDGGIKPNGSTTTGVKSDGVLSFAPKQISNFGWNWDFVLNSTKEPEFNVTIPGGIGYMKLHKPYVKVHAGIFVNFSSRFTSVTEVPQVQWTAGIKGHGSVNARMIAELKTLSSALADPFHEFKLPMLEKLEKPIWFSKINFAAGGLPLSVEPGFRIHARMYHTGSFQGTLQLGGKTHGTITPQLSFDSLKGLTNSVSGELLDVELWPPLWIIETKHFEMGAMLEPEIMLRGQFGNVRDATAAIEMRPYMNLSITRTPNQASMAHGEVKAFIAYPIRIMGLRPLTLDKRYKVNVSFNRLEKTSDMEMSWGQIEFHDHVLNFDFGDVPRHEVLTRPINVSVIEVDLDAGLASERHLGSASLQCMSLLNGVCQPSPSMASFLLPSGERVSIEFVMIWEDNPSPWISSKLRCVGMSFSRVLLQDSAYFTRNQNLTVRLTHAGRTYSSQLTQSSTNGHSVNPHSVLHGETRIEFGLTFLDSWMPCAFGACETAKIELLQGSNLLGSNVLPQIPWNSNLQAHSSLHRDFLGSSSMSTAERVPVTVALFGSGSTRRAAAVVEIDAYVTDPDHSSLFLKPNAPEKATSGDTKEIIWTISGANPIHTYSFSLSFWKLPLQTSTLQHGANWPSVGGRTLIPVGKNREIIATSCEKHPAEESSDEDLPCSFRQIITIDSDFFLEWEVLVVKIAWSSNGQSHEMFSSPIQILPSHAQLTLERRLWTQEDWNQRLSVHHQTCEKKDLYFSVGTGVLMRGKLENMNMPAAFPIFGDLQGKPMLTTGFKPLGQLKPGSHDVSDLLPAAVCKGGVCQGRVPGCTAGNFKIMHFPRLVFDFNRPYRYRNDPQGFQKVLQEAMAYAFSILPEVVTVIINELNTTMVRSTTKPQTLSTVLPSDTAISHLGWPMLTLTTAVPPTAGAPQYQQFSNGILSTTTIATVNPLQRWWGQSSRRLSVSSEGTSQKHLADNQVSVEFKNGVHYLVDDYLLKMMLEQHMFLEIDDDLSGELGPLRISSCQVFTDKHDAARTTNTLPRPSSMQEILAGVNMRGFQCIFLATLCGLLVLAMIAHRSQRRTVSHQEGYYLRAATDNCRSPRE